MSNTKTVKMYQLADAAYDMLQVREKGSFRDIRIHTAGDNMDDRKMRVIVNLLTTHFTVIAPQVEQKPNHLPAGTIVFLTDSIVNISVDDVSVQIVVDWDTSTVKLQVFSAKDAADVVNDNGSTKQYVVDDQAKGSTVNPLTAPEEPSVVFELSSVFELALQAVFNITARKAADTHKSHPAQGPRFVIVTDGQNTVAEDLAYTLVTRCDSKINSIFANAGEDYATPKTAGFILVNIHVDRKEDHQLISVKIEERLPMQKSVTVLDIVYSAGDGFAAISLSPPAQLDSDNSDGVDCEEVSHSSEPKAEVEFKVSPETKFQNEETADKVIMCLKGLARSTHAQSMKIALRYNESDEVTKDVVDGYMAKKFEREQWWSHKKFPLPIVPEDLANDGHVHVLRMDANSEGEISAYILRLNPLTGYRTFELLCLFGDADKLPQYTDDELELAQLRTECLLKDVELITMTPPSIQSMGFISGMQTMPPAYGPTGSITADEWVQLCKRANKIGSSLILTGSFGHKPLGLTTIRMSAIVVIPGTTQVRRVVFNISAESLPTGPQW